MAGPLQQRNFRLGHPSQGQQRKAKSPAAAGSKSDIRAHDLVNEHHKPGGGKAEQAANGESPQIMGPRRAASLQKQRGHGLHGTEQPDSQHEKKSISALLVLQK